MGLIKGTARLASEGVMLVLSPPSPPLGQGGGVINSAKWG